MNWLYNVSIDNAKINDKPEKKVVFNIWPSKMFYYFPLENICLLNLQNACFIIDMEVFSGARRE